MEREDNDFFDVARVIRLAPGPGIFKRDSLLEKTSLVLRKRESVSPVMSATTRNV